MKYVIGIVSVTILASSLLSADPKMNKVHRGMMRDGVKVNCNYCHKTPGNLPKKKGQDINALYKSKTCAGEGCHGSASK